jgi:hypothetical protein
MEHVMAQEEVKSLLRQLKLPIDERGRRRAANRAERFNQVNKPPEVYDIFGAPESDFRQAIGLGRALSLNLAVEAPRPHVYLETRHETVARDMRHET